MFKKVLVANRGEIAVRVMVACQQMGIGTVAIFSDVDKDAPHVRMADETVPLGDPTPSQSYLNIEKIIKATNDTFADAIHPGYGFLSENAKFAKRCRDEGIIFIGPTPETIELMGNKIAAKETMVKAGVPVIPGYWQKDQSMEKLMGETLRIGFPVMVKAAAGGGGKGLRIVHRKADLRDAIEGAQREATSAFGDGTVFLEKYLDKPRHIEFQVLADSKGNTVHLFDRECSIQRRHQKIIEETPSTAVNPELRVEMGEVAVKAAKAANYVNAGTVEFMMSGDGSYYFLEMNTRLQVEHPITEMVTGLDLVKWQLKIANGEKLAFKQKDLSQRGHAIECRIYAEDPERNFMPQTGKITQVSLPRGPFVRHEVGIISGIEITSWYDPMLAKLITYAETREEALQKMTWALEHYVTMGITTNVAFLKQVINHPAFKEGKITTHFIEDHLSKLAEKEKLPIEVLIAAGIFDFIHPHSEAVPVVTGETDPHTPWKSMGKWRLGA